MTVWIDVGDILDFATRGNSPSGIQRVGFELTLALLEVAWCEVRLCSSLGAADGSFEPVEPHEVIATYTALRSGRRGGGRERVATSQSWAWQRGIPRPTRGDVFLTLSPPSGTWSYVSSIQRIASRGVRVVAFVHDIIPILHPRWCEERVVLEFEAWHQALLPHVDTVITSSATVAADLTLWAQRTSVPLRRPVAIVRLGSGFRDHRGAGIPDLPIAVDLAPKPGFALFVSTIEPRKNHSLLIKVWRELLDALGPDQVPQLVCVGRVGWLVEDLIQHLRGEGSLGGKVLLLNDVTDAQLARLYSVCQFTVFPSHYEGWGLPVTESLAFGKLCLASHGGAIREAGGNLCSYFDPDSPADAGRTIRAIIEDQNLLDKLTARVKSEFNAVDWRASARQVLDQVGATVAQ
jgi:glycosyltransferase involved in cell wall biosynthesis